MSKSLNLDTLSTGLLGYGHPVRLRCLVLLEQEHSPSELFQLLSTAVDAPTLGTTAYHIRMLKQYGLVVETRTETRRGALEHYYLRTELADKLVVALAPLIGIPKREPGRPAKAKRQAQLLRVVGAEPALEIAA
jgi:hypothetical protein